MKAIEFAKEHPQIVVLLHGGGLSWWNYKDAAERLAQHYHVVIPLLDGHANSDRDFTTIEAAAEELCAYIQTQYGGRVLAIGGLSLGGQILVEVLSQHPDICQYAMIESALVIPMRCTNRLIAPHASYKLWTDSKTMVCKAAISSAAHQTGVVRCLLCRYLRYHTRKYDCLSQE